MSIFKNNRRTILRTAVYGAFIIIISFTFISCHLLLPPRSEQVDVEGRVTSVVEEYHEEVVELSTETNPDISVKSVEKTDKERYVVMLESTDGYRGIRSFSSRTPIKTGTYLVIGKSLMTYLELYGTVYGAITGRVEEVEMINDQIRIVLVEKPLEDFIKTIDLVINHGPDDIGITFPHPEASLEVRVGGVYVDLTQFVSGSIQISDFRFQYWSLEENNAETRVHMSGMFESELTLSVDAGISLSHLIGQELEARVQIPYANIFIPGELAAAGLEVFIGFDVSIDGSGSITISCSDPFSVTRIFNEQGFSKLPHEPDDPFQIGFDKIAVTSSGEISLGVYSNAGIGIRLRAAQKKLAYLDIYAGMRAYADTYKNSLGNAETAHGVDFIYGLDTGLRLMPEVLAGTGSEISTSLFDGDISIIPHRGTPEILSAAAASPTSVELTIQRNHDKTEQYEIQRGTTSSGEYETIQTVDVTGNEQRYTDDGLSEEM
ncbi:MAG: hypothetical protein K9L75_02655 [Spirochaetia bacterium]|nr:hypothetical protein [Spirochaetia bacterium]